MRAQRSLIAIMLVLSVAACGRQKPWREPLGAEMAHPIYQPGSPLNLRSGPGPEAEMAFFATFPAATYSPDQAKAGKQVYDSTCARCHPPGQLDGATFASAWKNRRLFDFYSLITNTMPQDRPGSLTDDQYLNVIAYILQRNQVPSSATKLSDDTLAMRRVRIDVGGGNAAAVPGGQ